MPRTVAKIAVSAATYWVDRPYDYLVPFDMIDAAKKELASLQAKKRRLFDSWEADDGAYTKEEFLERKAMYTHSIEQLQGKIKELEL